MKKDVCTALIVFLFLLGVVSIFVYFGEIRYELQAKEAKKEIAAYLQQANEALNQGSYSGAYTIADILISEGNRYDADDAGHDLNKRILTNEIAAIIEEHGDNSAPKLLFAIKERAKYNTRYSSEEEEKDMLKYAIKLVTTLGYKQTASLLQNALDQYPNDARW